MIQLDHKAESRTPEWHHPALPQHRNRINFGYLIAPELAVYGNSEQRLTHNKEGRKKKKEERKLALSITSPPYFISGTAQRTDPRSAAGAEKLRGLSADAQILTWPLPLLPLLEPPRWRDTHRHCRDSLSLSLSLCLSLFHSKAPLWQETDAVFKIIIKEYQRTNLNNNRDVFISLHLQIFRAVEPQFGASLIINEQKLKIAI